jgi:protein-disulfide isomerase
MTKQRQRVRRTTKPAPQKNVTTLQIGIVAGVAILMVVAFIFLNRPTGAPSPATSPGETVTLAVDLQGIPQGQTAEGSPVLGRADAPVTLVDYSDYRCPHCGDFTNQTLPRLIDEYIRTGKMRLIHKDMAILGQQSEWAAMAAQCANEQGRFWEYHFFLFEQTHAADRPLELTKKKLKEFASLLGLDSQQFAQCLDQDRYAGKVQSEREEGKQLGVEGTPTFFLNGQKIVGNVPYEQLKQAIDQVLEGAS